MKTAMAILCVSGVAVLAVGKPEVGMRVPPPSSRGYSVDAIRESGERGGMLIPTSTNFTAAHNRAMGEAMELWNAHRWVEAVQALRGIWQEQPASPWAAEAELHEACYLNYNARYDEAEERFVAVLKKHGNSVEMRRRVLHYLPDLYARSGRLQAALDLLAEMDKLPLTWQERQFVENYQRTYSRAKGKDDADRLCGTKALALALAAQNDRGETLRNVTMDAVFSRHAWARQKSAHAAGYALQELAELGGAQPVELDLTALRAAAAPGHPVLVHLKSPPEPRCSDVFEKPGREQNPPLSGHFVVVETVTRSYVDLLDPDAGRVRWPLAHFLYRWSGAALRLPGQTAVSGREIAPERALTLRGGCCGSPPPDPCDECEDGAGASAGSGSTGNGWSDGGPLASGGGIGVKCVGCGDDGKPGGPGGGGGGAVPCCETEQGQEKPAEISPPPLPTSHGAPTYHFGLSSANLSLRDIPLWGTDAKGPRVNIQLVYNRVATQRMAQHSNVNYYAFGNKWHFNFFSHFTETPEGSGDIVLPGGRVQRFLASEDENGNVVYDASDIWNQNALAKTNGCFVLTFKASGNKWYFNTNTAFGQRLEKIEDQYGSAVTLQYENSSGRLTNIVDAIGRNYRLYYNTAGYVTNVSDAFGRAALFEYDGGDLVALTDMGGLTTQIQYDTNHWPTNIVYPSGHAWRFAYETNVFEQYPGIYWTGPFQITVTDPLEQTQEYLYTAAGDYDRMPITVRDKAGNNWLYSTKQVGGDSSQGGTLRTYYTAVNAVTNYLGSGEYCVFADQWARSDFDVSTGQRLFTALANTNERTYIGWVCGPGSWIADVYTTNCYDAARNLRSTTLLTNCTVDPFSYYGQVSGGTVIGTWTNRYDAHDNLIWTRNPRDQETRYAYNAQDELTAVTNALGQFTLMSYDHDGNLTNLVDTLLRTNRWTYDANGRNFQSIYADGLTLSRGYDAIGRVNAVTNHGSGMRLSYFYDSLNRMRDVVFPDGTSNHFEYSCCGLDWTRDRLDRVTSYGRDALGRTISVTDPQNRLTEFRYNGVNQITNLITHVEGQQRVKRFDYTSTNGASRLTQVTTPMGKLLKYDYTFRGGLAWRQDGNGNVTKFEYDPLGRLVRVADTNDVTRVEMGYDVLGNVTRVASTNSVFEYSYDPLNRATNAVCLLTNIPGFATVKYQIAYQFDPVGNVTNRVITGLQGLTESITTRYQYDTMNRLTNVVQLTNAATTASAWYSYDAAGRLWKKGYGNGDVVTHSYDTESRLLSLGITNNTTPVWWYRYGWDNGGNILAITNNGTNVSLYGYDRAGQLTNEVCLTNGIAGGTTNSWQYDEAGNWRTGDGNWRLYNADNELVGIATTNAPVSIPVTVTGEVQPGLQSNKWYNTWASSRGVSAQVSQANGTFSLANVPLYPGTNDLVVTVTDVSGNTTQQVRTVSRAFPESFHYDGNGNLTNWANLTAGENWEYEWDWADRLTRVRSNGVTQVQHWYDASGQRIAKTERVGGVIQRWLYLWDGGEIVAVLNEAGQLRETFTRGVGLAGDIGTLIAVTHHVGSTTNGVFYAQNNHRGDVVLTRAGTATVGRYDYSAFGTPRSALGPDVCRFKFSSKECDPSTGLNYYGFRYYASTWQRWPNYDPIGEVGGMNLYSFTGNGPVTRVDTDGRMLVDGDGNRHPEPAVESAYNCAWRIFREVGATQAPSDDGHNRYRHCVGNCRISRECIGSRALAWAASWYQEVIRKPHWQPHESPGDMVANKRGRELATSCPKVSCEKACNAAYALHQLANE